MPATSAARQGPERAAEPAIEMAPEQHRAVFEALRKWRDERAKRDGRPRYVLFTNSQIARIVRSRPDTRAALEAGPGVGDARIRDHADDLVALLRTARDAGG